MAKEMNRLGDHEIIENPDKRTIAEANKELRRDNKGKAGKPSSGKAVSAERPDN